MRTENSPKTGKPAPSPRRVKQDAEEIRRQTPTTKHSTALNLAAQARGWPSYKQLVRDWRDAAREQAGHLVTLTAKWVDRDQSRGTFTAHVLLSEPWENHLPLGVRRQTYTLRQFHVARGDRTKLVAPNTFTSALSCMHNLSKAARQLVFVDVMRVYPTSLTKAVNAFDGDPYKMLTTRYPNQDHETLWFDPTNGLHFILNEPYQIDKPKQAPVLAARKMVTHVTRAWTIHNPEGTLAQLIARSKDVQLFDRLVERTDALPNRFRGIRFTDESGNDVTQSH